MKREQGMGKRCRAAVLVLAVVACQRGEPAQRASEQSVAAAQAVGNGPAANGPRARWPNDGCGWIPVAEVEAILGKLTGPPRGGKTTCAYPLPMDTETATARAQYKKLARDLAGPNSPAARDTTMNSVAVIVSVDLRGDVTGERAGKMTSAMLAKMFAGAMGKNTPADTASRQTEPVRPAGWDRANPPHGKSDFAGRIGHLIVSVDENSDMFGAVPAEKKAELAARVRDRVPDLPFVYPFLGPGPFSPPSDPDPCSLLTREETEPVLGKLLAPPYRSHDGGPYANPNGSSCAYYTAGHHVLVITPRWTRGKQAFEISRGVGTLVTSVAADPDRELADTLDGPWDDALLDLDGSLVFLKGDQMLEVKYLTSSTDATGAVKLARIALKRLVSKAQTP